MRLTLAKNLASIALMTAAMGATAIAAPTNKELKIGINQEFENLNPMIAQTTANSYIASMVNHTLVTMDEKTEWVPQLAKEVPTIENGLAKFVGEGKDRKIVAAWEIKENAVWADGTPVTGHDVKFSWEYCTAEGGGCADRRQLSNYAYRRRLPDPNLPTTAAQPPDHDRHARRHPRQDRHATRCRGRRFSARAGRVAGPRRDAGVDRGDGGAAACAELAPVARRRARGGRRSGGAGRDAAGGERGAAGGQGPRPRRRTAAGRRLVGGAGRRVGAALGRLGQPHGLRAGQPGVAPAAAAAAAPTARPPAAAHRQARLARPAAAAAALLLRSPSTCDGRGSSVIQMHRRRPSVARDTDVIGRRRRARPPVL